MEVGGKININTLKPVGNYSVAPTTIKTSSLKPIGGGEYHAGGPKPTGLSAEQIRKDPNRMSTIRDYMVKRKGAQFADTSDEELYDAFVTHMRWKDNNEVSVVKELTWINNQSDEDLMSAGNAYKVFDELGGVFSNDGIGGAISGTGTYVASNLSNPSNLLGPWFGRLIAGTASKTVIDTSLKAAIKLASDRAMKSAAEKGLAEAAIKAAGEQAAKDTMIKLAPIAAAKKAAVKTTAVKQAAGATVADAGMAVGFDAATQRTRIETGAQDEYSVAQGLLSAGLGVIGGGVSYFPQAVRGASGLADTGAKYTRGKIESEAAARKKLGPAAQKMATKFSKRMDSWKSAVVSGQKLNDSVEFQRQVVRTLLGEQEDGSEGLLKEMMVDAGIQFDHRPEAPRVMEQAVDFTRSLPKEVKKVLNKEIEDLGITFDEMMDIMASTMKHGGESLGLASRFSDSVDRLVKAKAVANKLIIQQAKDEKATEKHRLMYAQSIWKRSLVANIATTAVNVKGWGIVSAFDMGSKLVQALGGYGIGAVASVVPTKSAKNLKEAAFNRANAELGASVFKLKTLFDPYTTKDAAEEYINQLNTKFSKKMGESVFGVETSGPEHFGLSKSSTPVRLAEAWANGTAFISGMKLQDTFTKASSFLTELDRLTRLTYKKPLSQMLEEGNAHLISDEINFKAIDKALRDSFSGDYTKGYGKLSLPAKLLESISNMPILGTIVPFGRFLNNLLAFYAQYSPLGAAPLLARMISKGFFTKKAFTHLMGSDENLNVLGKAIAGSMAIAYLMDIERDKIEQGIPWNISVDSSGSPNKLDNMAPISGYVLASRILVLWFAGEKANGDGLLRDAGTQFVLGQLSRDLTDTSGLNEVVQYFLSANDDDQEEKFKMDVLGQMGNWLGLTYAAGFMRPLEPINTVNNIRQGDQRTVDRKQLEGEEKFIANTFRYIDSFFSSIQTPDEQGRKNFGKPLFLPNKPGEDYDVSPLGRLMGKPEDRPLTNADRMLAMVNMPAWTVAERSVSPELNSLVNQVLQPMFEKDATVMLKSQKWLSMNVRERTNWVNAYLTGLKTKARNIIAEKSFTGMRLTAYKGWMSKSEDLRLSAKKHFNLTNVPDDQLTIEQIQVLEYYLSQEQKMTNKFVE